MEDPMPGKGQEGAQTPKTDSVSASSRPPSPFPSSGFDAIDTSESLEEETYSWYSPRKFYSVRIGEVFQGKYQVIMKLGFGTASTTWLCRDLKEHRYVTVNIYAVGQQKMSRELAALNHINTVISSPPFRHRSLARWSRRENLCLVYKPLGMSLADMRKAMFKGRIPLLMAKGVMLYILRALDFLHRKANMVHADIQEDNIMFLLEEEDCLREAEADELGSDQSLRKIYKAMPTFFEYDPFYG